MGRALDLLAGDPARRAAMGNQGRNLARSFSIERSANALAQVYAGLADQRGAGGDKLSLRSFGQNAGEAAEAARL
jgi:hypothetical protein